MNKELMRAISRRTTATTTTQSPPYKARREREGNMVKRWMCCMCGYAIVSGAIPLLLLADGGPDRNSWMVVRENERQACTYSECST